MLLWKLEQEFKEKVENAKQEFEKQLKNAKNKVMYDNITIKELLDLGFNNNYLILSNKKKVELGYVDENNIYSKKLTKKQLETKVYMQEDFGWYDDDLDSDNYHIAKVYCVDTKDERFFK